LAVKAASGEKEERPECLLLGNVYELYAGFKKVYSYLNVDFPSLLSCSLPWSILAGESDT
jgi:hypothetical protein